MSPASSPEALGWEAFARRLMVVFAGLLLLVGGGSSALSALRLKALLQNSRTQRGQALAIATARAAFVPLSLEDRAELARVAAYYEGQSSLASLRIYDERGVEWARYARGAARSGIEASAPIAAPSAAAGAPPIGRVDVVMDAEDIRETLARHVASIFLFNGAFALSILLGGLHIIRRLTTGMHELARRAARADDLSRSNRELEEFAYIASHDLQAPLRRITGFAQLLSRRYKGKLDAEADEFIERLVAGTDRMQRLIQDLLSYSRAGSRPLEVFRSDLNDVLRGVVEDLEGAIKDSDGRVVVSPLPTMHVDAGQVSRLFQNLIANALKFRGDAPPVVRVSARREGDEWVFAVADNGIGIEPRHAEEIFKMFRRLHPASKYSGTGIGLAIARKIVERHGGRIWVDSRPGEGSIFYFTLGPTHGPQTEERHG